MLQLPNCVGELDVYSSLYLNLIFSNLCITFVPYQGNCVYEFQVNPRELLTHALLLAAKATPNEMYSPRVLDALLQLIQSDSDFNDGSMYVISYLCSYALEDNNLSMHDADTHSLQGGQLIKGLSALLALFVDNAPAGEDSMVTNKNTNAISEVKPVKKTVAKKKVSKSSNIGGIGSIGQPIVRKKKTSSKLVKDAMKPKAMKKVDKSDLILGGKANKESEDSPTKQLARKSVLSCISQLSTYYVEVDVIKLIQFLTSWAIGDPHDECRSLGCKALGDIVSKYTNEGNSDEVMKLVKNILSSGKATDKGAYDKKPPNSVQASDFRKEGTVLALGACALSHFNCSTWKH